MLDEKSNVGMPATLHTVVLHLTVALCVMQRFVYLMILPFPFSSSFTVNNGIAITVLQAFKGSQCTSIGFRSSQIPSQKRKQNWKRRKNKHRAHRTQQQKKWNGKKTLEMYGERKSSTKKKKTNTRRK